MEGGSGGQGQKGPDPDRRHPHRSSSNGSCSDDAYAGSAISAGRCWLTDNDTREMSCKSNVCCGPFCSESSVAVCRSSGLEMLARVVRVILPSLDHHLPSLVPPTAMGQWKRLLSNRQSHPIPGISASSSKEGGDLKPMSLLTRRKSPVSRRLLWAGIAASASYLGLACTNQPSAGVRLVMHADIDADYNQVTLEIKNNDPGRAFRIRHWGFSAHNGQSVCASSDLMGVCLSVRVCDQRSAGLAPRTPWSD